MSYRDFTCIISISFEASSNDLPLVSGMVKVRIADIIEITDKNPMAKLSPYVLNRYGLY